MVSQTYTSTYRKSRALIIGIDSYSDPQFSRLNQAETDAKSVASLLQSAKYKFQVKTLLGQEASRPTILEALNDLRSADVNDRILFYFAGHGYATSDNFSQEKGFIVCFDTEQGKDFTALSLEDVIALCKYSHAKHIGFIFDACFSGQVLGLTRVSPVSIQKYLTRRAYQVITAGAGDQTVIDFNSMTTLMVDALKNGLAENEEPLTLSSLGLYLKQKITADYGKTQIPQFGHLSGSQGGEFVFGIREYKKLISPSKVVDETITPILPAKGIFTAEIDLSGRLEDFSCPTVLTISAGLSISLAISGAEKEKAVQILRRDRPQWGNTRLNVYLYTIMLYMLLKEHIHKLDYVTIDPEYPGYEGLVKEKILSLFRVSGKNISKEKIRFVRLDKKSPARNMASKIFKKQADPDIMISASNIEDFFKK